LRQSLLEQFGTSTKFRWYESAVPPTATELLLRKRSNATCHSRPNAPPQAGLQRSF